MARQNLSKFCQNLVKNVYVYSGIAGKVEADFLLTLETNAISYQLYVASLTGNISETICQNIMKLHQ